MLREMEKSQLKLNLPVSTTFGFIIHQTGHNDGILFWSGTAIGVRHVGREEFFIYIIDAR